MSPLAGKDKARASTKGKARQLSTKSASAVKTGPHRETFELVPEGPHGIRLPSEEGDAERDLTETDDGEGEEEEEEESVVGSETTGSNDDDEDYNQDHSPVPAPRKGESSTCNAKAQTPLPSSPLEKKPRGSRSAVTKNIERKMDDLSLRDNDSLDDDSVVILPSKKFKPQSRMRAPMVTPSESFPSEDELGMNVRLPGGTTKKKRCVIFAVCIYISTDILIAANSRRKPS